MREELITPFTFEDPEKERAFNKFQVDRYIFPPEQQIFTTTKGAIIVPLNKFFNLGDPKVDIFSMSSKTKKCYNSPEVRNHICRYMNFFEAFYDYDREYIMILNTIKMMTDRHPNYDVNALIYDVTRYILSPSIVAKVERMVEDNYIIDLKYRNNQNQALQYDNTHGKVLMCITIYLNMIIPLASHFIYMRNVEFVDDFLKEVFDPIIHFYDYKVDIFSKCYETTTSSVKNNASRNSVIWGKQDIRGKDIYTHSDDSLDNIILNIMPKYVFDQHMVNFNFTSIKRNIGFQVTDISFEYNFIPLSSSKRDADSNSEYDKFESYLIKQNESTYLLNKVNCDQSCETIERLYGPYSEEEVNYYREQLKVRGETSIHPFQKELVYYPFYKYFGDTLSIDGINEDMYIRFIISAKKMFQQERFIILPEIFSCRINKFVDRKSVNKSLLQKIEASAHYPAIVQKYRNPKIIKRMLSVIATIIASDLTMINYDNQEFTGVPIPINQDVLCEEICVFVLLI